jgi:hypothetical protein
MLDTILSVFGLSAGGVYYKPIYFSTTIDYLIFKNESTAIEGVSLRILTFSMPSFNLF